MAISSDVAFTPTVKALQAEHGSRAAYARMEANGGWRTLVNDDLAGRLAAADSFYLATSNADGQPYIQHRGGPPGFLRVIGPTTLGFADYRGNRQFITSGNLTDNPRAFIFVMDYAHLRRVKIWGTARVSDDPEVIARLFPEGYDAKADQAILFEVSAWDTNCSQHIPRKIPYRDAAAALAALQARVTELENTVAALRRPADLGPSAATTLSRGRRGAASGVVSDTSSDTAH